MEETPHTNQAHSRVKDLVDGIEKRFGKNHFAAFLGLELVEADEGKITIALPVRPQHYQNMSFVHGGILATMADVAMGFAAVTVAPPEAHVLTGDLRISYLNPGIGERILARGYCLKIGRRIVFTEAEIFIEEHRNAPQHWIAKASASMIIVQPAG